MIVFLPWRREFSRFFRAAGAQRDVSLRGKLETELVGDAAHRPASIEFDDGLPCEFVFFICVEKGVDAEWPEKVVFCEQGF